MTTLLNNKVLKEKQIGQDLKLKIYKNEATERIFVEFSSLDGRMIVQRSYQDSLGGREEAKKFEKKFKSLNDLKKFLNRGKT